MTGLANPCMSSHPMASPTFCLVSIEVSSLTVTCDCSCLVIIKRFRFYRNLLLFFRISVLSLLLLLLLLLFFFTGRTRSESQISRTASLSATKLNSYVDPYPTMCSARFGVDLDYRSGSRAKSGFSDFPHYLRNLPSDLQMQYL